MNYSAKKLATELQQLQKKPFGAAAKRRVPSQLDAAAFSIEPGVKEFLDRRRKHAENTRNLCVGVY